MAVIKYEISLCEEHYKKPYRPIDTQTYKGT